MFNKEIKFISDLSLNNIKNLGTFFTIEKLLSANLHPAITTYISAEIDYLIYQDRQRLLKESVFDYSGNGISKYFYMISDEIKRTKRISFEDVKRLIIQAVSFNANYTVRPRWSITKLIFEDGPTKSVEEINLILNYVHYASYLKKIILEYLTRRKLSNLSITEFELIISKIDRELFNSQPEKLVENSLYSMADFFNIGAISKTKINVGYFELFLKEKNLIEYLLRLNRAVSKDSRTNLEIVELKKIIFSDQPVSLEPEAEIGFAEPESIEFEKVESAEVETINDKMEDTLAAKPKDETKPEEIILDEITFQDEPKAKAIIPDEISPVNNEDFSDSDELENLLKDIPDEKVDEDKIPLTPEKEKELFEFFNSELETNNETFMPVEKPGNVEEQFNFDDSSAVEENFVEGQSNENVTEIKFVDIETEQPAQENLAEDMLNIDKQVFIDTKTETTDLKPEEIKFFPEEIIEPLPPPKKDLSSYLTNKETDRIVSDIFNEDRDDFVITIEKITECRNYEEATEILKTVFLSSRINPFSREAVVLTNAVSNYFNNI